MKTVAKFAVMTVVAAGLAAAAMPVIAADSAVAVQLAAGSEQDGYIDKAQREMAEWKRKVAGFGRDVKREGSEMKKDASEKLSKAWDEVEENWQELKQAGKTAGDKSWEKAREAYETSRKKLQETWNDIES
ncbi:MAG: hypothetical protein GEU92_11465 [Alphaproteobacteria bacterium]|nr:hypothetical protein [Alphaproteobacteria bacterium]